MHAVKRWPQDASRLGTCEALLRFSSHSSQAHLRLFVTFATTYLWFPNYCPVSGSLELPGALAKAGSPVRMQQQAVRAAVHRLTLHTTRLAWHDVSAA